MLHWLPYKKSGLFFGRKSLEASEDITLNILYPKEHNIDTKKRDLLELILFISLAHHVFFLNL